MADRGGGEELNRDQKAQAIAEIAERLSNTDTVIATAFHGLGVREIEDLRSKLREADGQFQVVKNTLARRACAETGRETLVEYLQGQTALVWGQGDAAAIAKTLSTFGKATEDRLTMKGGILDGAPISAGELKQLTANALGSLISGMARALGAYHAQRASEPDAQAEVASEAAVEPVAEEAPAPEAAVTAEDTTTEDTPEATPEASADDTPEAAQEPAADDTTDAEPAADETTEGDS
jgi:large subunit ribosomal protein L10